MVRVRMVGDDGVVLLDKEQNNYGTTSSFKKEEEEHPMERIRIHSKRDNDQSKMVQVRACISRFLHHNHYFHIAVTILILLDIAIIITMLILEALQRDGYCIAKYLNTSSISSTKDRSEQLEKYKTAIEVEHVLHYVSLSVLSLFMLEFVVKIFASGLSFFSHTLEVVDVVVVTVTLLLELLLKKDAVTGTVGLLLLVRLWRIVHIVTNVTETINMVEGERVEELQKLVFDLQGEVQRLKMLAV